MLRGNPNAIILDQNSDHRPEIFGGNVHPGPDGFFHVGQRIQKQIGQGLFQSLAMRQDPRQGTLDGEGGPFL